MPAFLLFSLTHKLTALSPSSPLRFFFVSLFLILVHFFSNPLSVFFFFFFSHFAFWFLISFEQIQVCWQMKVTSMLTAVSPAVVPLGDGVQPVAAEGEERWLRGSRGAVMSATVTETTLCSGSTAWRIILQQTCRNCDLSLLSLYMIVWFLAREDKGLLGRVATLPSFSYGNKTESQSEAAY